MKLLQQEVENNRKNIRHEALTFSLSELVNIHRDEEILIRPDFQRLFRWTRVQQTSFIESLLLEIPIPPLFFFEKNDGKWELLDGLQRLSTIIRFIGTGQDVPTEYRGAEHNDEEWHDQYQNVLDVPLQLNAGEYLKQLYGVTYVRLPTPLQLNLKRARLNVYVLKRETHEIYKYEVFKRLNTGGSHLEDQEIRNCSIRLLSDEFPDFLQNISTDETFQTVLGLSGESLRNGYTEELALRFFAMKNKGDDFIHDVSNFLTQYLQQVAKEEVPFDYKQEEHLFHKTWQEIRRAFPDGEAFRAKNERGTSQGPFSPTLFEMVSLAIAQDIDKVSQLLEEVLRSKIIELIKKAKQEGLTGAGSNSLKKTKGRLLAARQWFSTHG